MKTFITLAAICIFFSCKTTQVTSSWVKPDTETGNFKNIMVMAVLSDQNRGIQQKMEAHVVNELMKKGYNATSFFALNGPQAMNKADEQSAIAAIGKSNADAVLTIVLLDTAKEHRYVPGTVSYYPSGYYNRFWGYYVNTYDRIYSPGYYTVNTRYYWETNLYRASNQELIYSVSTESFEPGSVDKLAEQYGEVIVKDMIRHSVIDKRK